MGINREIQLHVACTMMPKKFAITQEELKEVEICQFAAAFRPESFGAIPLNQIDRIFDEFKQSVVTKMRAHGMLRAGE